jgi:thiamine biosynthesis lipoprotein
MRHVFEAMGTVASVDVPDAEAMLLPGIESIFRAIDGRFSLFTADSELSLIARGELALPDSSGEMLASYARALEWRTATEGLFSPHRPDGVLDLNGIVKAEAIEQAGELLDGGASSRWSINVGGDILIRSDGVPWIIGIADPADSGQLLSSVSLRGTRRAVATSGSAQRGDHIWLGGELAPADYVQVSVMADDIVTADVLATVIVAGGRPALDDIADRWPVDILAVGRDGGILATPGFRQAMAPTA